MHPFTAAWRSRSRSDLGDTVLQATPHKRARHLVTSPAFSAQAALLAEHRQWVRDGLPASGKGIGLSS
jgi:hypothetical protein